MKGICKYFGGVHALEDVDFELYPHEVLALVGDNGAGKSTLIKVIAGVHPPDRGEIYIEDKKVEIHSPIHARALGIETVYQELALVETRDVADNFFLGREPTLDRRHLGGQKEDHGDDRQYVEETGHHHPLIEDSRSLSFWRSAPGPGGGTGYTVGWQDNHHG